MEREAQLQYPHLQEPCDSYKIKDMLETQTPKCALFSHQRAHSVSGDVSLRITAPKNRTAGKSRSCLRGTSILGETFAFSQSRMGQEGGSVGPACPKYPVCMACAPWLPACLQSRRSRRWLPMLPLVPQPHSIDATEGASARGHQGRGSYFFPSGKAKIRSTYKGPHISERNGSSPGRGPA